MRVTLWGTRGSLGSHGPETVRYGGNTSCVEVRGSGGALLVIDCGTGARRLGASIGPDAARVDILLSHLHMDHILGIGFFSPLYRPGQEVHIWGPPSTTQHLRDRLTRYLSPPLFPVRLRDLPSDLTLHDVPLQPFEIGGLRVAASFICHPGPTVGYRISGDGASMTYLSDHEPALGCRRFPDHPQWTSGFDLATGVDLLIHDSQYTAEEYRAHIGWGHSALTHALDFAALAGVKRFLTFHHDPAHSDDVLDGMLADARASSQPRFQVDPGREGATFEV